MTKDIQKQDNNSLGRSAGNKLDFTNINMESLSTALSNVDLPRTFYQLVVFVLDGSASMGLNGISGKPKGEEIENSVKQTIDRLKKSKNNKSFDVCVWGYANEYIEIMPITTVNDIEDSFCLNPCNYIEKNMATKLAEVMKTVKSQCDDYLNKYKTKNTQALILILSDGAIHDQSATEEVCDSIKERENNQTTIASTLFESKEWEDDNLQFLKDNLESLSSGPNFFTSSFNPEEIRKHMIKSISVLSQIV